MHDTSRARESTSVQQCKRNSQLEVSVVTIAASDWPLHCVATCDLRAASYVDEP